MTVATLLAHMMRRERVEVIRTDLLPLMEPWGKAWRELCAEVGVVCPEELVALGDAMADAIVYIEVAGHGYAMLTPKQASDERAHLLKRLTHEYGSERKSPLLNNRTQMLPIFGEDGDVLLLAPDGRVHAMTHDDPDTDEVVAVSFDALVKIAKPGALNPE